MKRSITLFFSLCVFFITPIFCGCNFINFEKDGISYEWNRFSDILGVRSVYLNSFSHSYRNVAPNALKTDSIKNFLLHEIDQEIEILRSQKIDTCFLIAKDHGDVIGFFSFDLSQYPENIFIRKSAIRTDYKRMHIGSNILNGILNENRDLYRLVCAVRRINLEGLYFLDSFGFKVAKNIPANQDSSNATHENSPRQSLGINNILLAPLVSDPFAQKEIEPSMHDRNFSKKIYRTLEYVNPLYIPNS